MMLGSAMNLIYEQLQRVSKYQFPPKSVSPMIFFEVFIGQRSINSTMKLLFISYLSETMEIPVRKKNIFQAIQSYRHSSPHVSQYFREGSYKR